MGQITCIGLDVHARSIRAAALDPNSGEVVERRLEAADGAVIAFASEVQERFGDVECVYEAGPTGFHLARALEGAGLRVAVLAPSKLPRPSGEKVKTDKRDARFLARVGVMGEYAQVRIPTIEEESARDLSRAREDARVELMASRHRVSKMLLRLGFVYPRKTTWGKDHAIWLRKIRREGLGGMGAGTLIAFDSAFESVQANTLRRNELDHAIEIAAAEAPFADVLVRLRCLRGISTLSAFGLCVELGDFSRFTPTSIGAFVGLTPSEHSSGQSRTQGGITRAGNSHARRLLVEAAWQHAPMYNPGPVMRGQWAKAPTPVATHANKGNRRLHRRWVNMKAKGKRGNIITAAVARELAGWCQVLATMDA